MNAAVARPVSSDRRPVAASSGQAALDDGAWPAGLKLLLALLGGFCVIVGYVLYLAAQMPS